MELELVGWSYMVGGIIRLGLGDFSRHGFLTYTGLGYNRGERSV